MNEELRALSARTGALLLARGLLLVTAESCTGGLLSGALTGVAGSSRWFDRGFVTYSNDAKRQMLGVSGASLDAHGAVSETVVAEMALGALAHSAAGASIAISGVAGPDGGTPAKPVGTVCVGCALATGEAVQCSVHYAGDREAVRLQACAGALQQLVALLDGDSRH